MLKVQLLLLFFSDLMYVIISSSKVKSNLNDCSIGFVRKSCFVCRCNTFFNLFWDIEEKVVKCICYLHFFCYQLSIIVYVPNFLGVFFWLMLIISLIPFQALFSLFLLSSKKVLLRFALLSLAILLREFL